MDCRMRTISKFAATPQFPFFKDVSTSINGLIQQILDESNKNVTILQETEPQEVSTGM